MWDVNDILIRMIKSIYLFQDISDQEALDLSTHFKLNFYKAWNTIFRQGQNHDKIFILKNWLLEARKANWHSSIVLWKIMPWEIFWEMSYFKKTSATASVLVLQDSDIWEVDNVKFDIFLKKYPHIMDVVYNTMKKRDDENKEKLNNSNKSDLWDLDDIQIII